MFATVPASFTSTVTGSCARPVASACFSSSAIAACTAGESMSPCTTTFAGSAFPGKASCMRS